MVLASLFQQIDFHCADVNRCLKLKTDHRADVPNQITEFDFPIALLPAALENSEIETTPVIETLQLIKKSFS